MVDGWLGLLTAINRRCWSNVYVKQNTTRHGKNLANARSKTGEVISLKAANLKEDHRFAEFGEGAKNLDLNFIEVYLPEGGQSVFTSVNAVFISISRN